jgi:hypothetical protein
LLELYSDVVEIDHYDPHETPAHIIALREAGVSIYDLRTELLRRMNDFNSK